MRFPLRFELSESVRSKRNVAECGVSFFLCRMKPHTPAFMFCRTKKIRTVRIFFIFLWHCVSVLR